MSYPTHRTMYENEGTTKLAEEDHHRLLASERRRLTLEVLSDRPSSVALDELAAEVAAREHENAGERATETVAVSLHHVHLPKMANLGALSYDPETNQIEPHRFLVTT